MDEAEYRKKFASSGGKARAKNMSAKDRHESALMAGLANKARLSRLSLKSKQQKKAT